MEIKICGRCKENKTKDQFYTDHSKKDGLCYQCRECAGKYRKKYTKENKEKVLASKKRYRDKNRSQLLEKQKIWREENKEKRSAIGKKYYQENKKKIVAYRKQYDKKNKEKNKRSRNNYRIKRRKTDPAYKIVENLRGRIRYALKGKNKSEITMKILGCTAYELKAHLEKQFTEGMNWETYGYYGWHIDHIKPCVSFDLSDPAQQKECFHYSNLQPLWANDNFKKRDKY